MSSSISSFSHFPLEIKRVIWGLAHQHDSKFYCIMRLVCKAWEKAHYEYAPMKELVRRRECLPAASLTYKRHIELFLSEKFYPLYAIYDCIKDINTLQKMRKEILVTDTASGTSVNKPPFSVSDTYILEWEREKELKKTTKNIKTVNLPKVYPNFYDDDQTEMLLALSTPSAHYDSYWIFISALRFKLKINLQEILKIIDNKHGFKADISKALMASLGYPIPFACLENDNGVSDRIKADEIFIYLSYIKGSKFQDIVSFGENKHRMRRRSFIEAFIIRLLVEMSGDLYESYRKFGQYNLNEQCSEQILSLNLDEYFLTKALRREDYKEILVAFFTFLDLELYNSNPLNILDNEFVDECIEEYRRIKKGSIPSKMNIPATERSIKEFVYEKIKRLAYLILSGILHLLFFIERNLRRPSVTRNWIRI